MYIYTPVTILFSLSIPCTLLFSHYISGFLDKSLICLTENKRLFTNKQTYGYHGYGGWYSFNVDLKFSKSLIVQMLYSNWFQ